MNWLELSGWKTGNGTPSGVDRIYLPGNTASPQDIGAVLSSGLQVGIYEGAAWYGVDPILAARRISTNANSLIPRVGAQEAPPLMLDMEGADYAFYMNLVEEYRKHQPRRPTSFTTEPWKGDGRILPFQTFLAAGLHWYPQCYDNNGAIDSAAVILNACRAYPSAMVHPFYKETLLPPGPQLDGCVFP